MKYKELLQHFDKTRTAIKLIDSKYGEANDDRIMGKYNNSLWNLRNTLELVLKNIYTNSINESLPETGLKNIIKEIQSTKTIPDTLIPSVRTVQSFGNQGAHTDGNGVSDFTHEKVNPAFLSMELILNWFKYEYHGFSPNEEDIFLQSHNKFYLNDLKISDLWDTSKYVSNESILIVLGAHTKYEVFERIPAELLKKHIDEQGDYKKGRRAIIVTDFWYREDKALHNKYIIAFGPVGRNYVVDIISEKKPGIELSDISTDRCRVMNSDNNILFMDEAPDAAYKAVRKFISNNNGLKRFLDNAWQRN